jgi:hypothetical protein
MGKTTAETEIYSMARGDGQKDGEEECDFAREGWGKKRNINKRGEKAITTRPTRYAGHRSPGMEWHCCCGVEIKPEIRYTHTHTHTHICARAHIAIVQK